MNSSPDSHPTRRHFVGRRISYDGKTGRVTDCPEANAYLAKEYRKGWALEG